MRVNNRAAECSQYAYGNTVNLSQIWLKVDTKQKKEWHSLLVTCLSQVYAFKHGQSRVINRDITLRVTEKVRNIKNSVFLRHCVCVLHVKAAIQNLFWLV